MRTSLLTGMLLGGALLLTQGATRAEGPAPETQAERDARMQWWREARFGMFIHWGLYAVPAGTYDGKPIGGIGEWIMNRGKIPVDVYAKYAEQFNPVKFNAADWVRVAKDAGMKYIVITSKHHDGFAMFKSAASPYNIVDATPYKKDPLKDLAEACRKEGIKLGFYYSQAQDWHHRGGAAAGGHWDKEKQDGPMDDYLERIAIPQVKEILSNYGEFPAVLWWDTPVDMTPARAAKLYQVMHELKPGIIWNNRLGGGFKGDTETPEQHIPPKGYPGRDWETCMTMNGTWGFKSYDHNWKPTTTLIQNLCDIASKGGNYLLNVGPTAEGLIPQPSIERLAEVGQWMKVNGEAIYGTSASPFPEQLPWGRVTQKGARLNLLVFNMPRDRALTLPGLKTKVTKAYALADAGRKPLDVVAADDGVKILLPEGFALAPHATVIVAELEGAPDVAAAPAPEPKRVAPEPDGALKLKAADATVVGAKAKLEDGHIGFWLDAKDYVKWTTAIDKPGTYAVRLEYACPGSSAGSEIEVVIGGAKVTGRVAGTGDNWKNFKWVDLGEVALEKVDKVEVAVKATAKPGLAVMNLRAVLLAPAVPK